MSYLRLAITTIFAIACLLVSPMNAQSETLSFSHAQLKGRDFSGRVLAGSGFANANMEGANFENADLRGSVFSASFYAMPIYEEQIFQEDY
jgi:uncharacterized protein YjbI with pentapeptide repeats